MLVPPTSPFEPSWPFTLPRIASTAAHASQNAQTPLFMSQARRGVSLVLNTMIPPALEGTNANSGLQNTTSSFPINARNALVSTTSLNVQRSALSIAACLIRSM